MVEEPNGNVASDNVANDNVASNNQGGFVSRPDDNTCTEVITSKPMLSPESIDGLLWCCYLAEMRSFPGRIASVDDFMHVWKHDFVARSAGYATSSSSQVPSDSNVLGNEEPSGRGVVEREGGVRGGGRPRVPDFEDIHEHVLLTPVSPIDLTNGPAVPKSDKGKAKATKAKASKGEPTRGKAKSVKAAEGVVVKSRSRLKAFNKLVNHMVTKVYKGNFNKFFYEVILEEATCTNFLHKVDQAALYIDKQANVFDIKSVAELV